MPLVAMRSAATALNPNGDTSANELAKPPLMARVPSVTAELDQLGIHPVTNRAGAAALASSTSPLPGTIAALPIRATASAQLVTLRVRVRISATLQAPVSDVPAPHHLRLPRGGPVGTV